MFQKFSWSQYWTVVIALVAVYYAIVFVLLYKNGLFNKAAFKRLIPAKHRPQIPSQPPAEVPAVKSAAKLNNQDETENQLKKLIDELLQFLQEIAGKSFIKEEVIMGLQVILLEYKEFSQTNYQSDINAFIKAETEHHCSIDLSDEEIKRVWMG